MSQQDQRLERLYAALSARERVTLILRAWREGRDHDPQIRYTIPTNQVSEYNRLIGMLQAASGDLTHFVGIVYQAIEQLDLRFAWLLTLWAWARNVDGLQRHLASARSPDVQKLIGYAPLRLGDDPESVRRGEEAPGMERLAGVLIDTLYDGIRSRSQELRAVEIVLGELSVELDGEDVLHPEVRAILSEARQRLEELNRSMARFGGPAELKEPPAALVEQLREIAEQAIER